jgi:lactaldehyde dehydrogenase/glycolaldehyde dehydrogenase
MKATTYGDPLGNTPVDMGPLINRDAVTRIAGMVQRAVAGGAELLTLRLPHKSGMNRS